MDSLWIGTVTFLIGLKTAKYVILFFDVLYMQNFAQICIYLSNIINNVDEINFEDFC